MSDKSQSEMKKNQAFVRALSSSRKTYGTSHPRAFIVSLDRENFYKVHALNSRQALSIVMSIGANPPATTPPPPAPGKKSPSHSKSFCSAIFISKDAAAQMLKRDLSLRKSMLKARYKVKKQLKSIPKGKSN